MSKPAPPAPPAVHATPQQALVAYMALTGDEMAALRSLAKLNAYRTGFTEPIDVIHEVLDRVLSRDRLWPMHVNFGLFMALAIRSVCDAERQLHENAMRSPMPFEEALEQEQFLVSSIEDDLVAVEGARMARRAAERARAALAGDREALKVLDGMMAGMSPRDMCEGFSMTRKDFDAARHRAMRRVETGFDLH